MSVTWRVFGFCASSDSKVSSISLLAGTSLAGVGRVDEKLIAKKGGERPVSSIKPLLETH